MTTCKGCGIKIQYANKLKPGFSPKTDVEYCQRCFRIKHYDDFVFSMKTGINPDLILKRIAEIKGLIIWVVDLFDFEASMIEGLNRHLNKRDIILIASKKDLLPREITDDKITKFIKERLNEYGIKIRGILITSKNESKNRDLILDLLKKESNGQDIVVIGKANVGKSTFINMLIGNDILTKSKYPGTTLDFNEIMIDNQKYIDTPGIEVKNSMLMLMDESKLNNIIPTKCLKPKVYQLEGNQTIFIGGLVRLDLINAKKANAVIYVSDKLLIHRSKLSNADKIWDKRGQMLLPAVDSKLNNMVIKPLYEKMDIVIDGLGWICINSNISEIRVIYPKDVNITFRKAMV